MKKRYGDTKTNLELSAKAQEVYAGSDPLNIFEHDDGTYSMTGIIEQNGLTAQEVNEWLEDLADELSKADDED